MAATNPPLFDGRNDPDLVAALTHLGIPRDGVVLVHSGIKCLVRTGHELETLLSTLVRYMSNGTLLMPAMSWRHVSPSGPLFDELATPSNVGALAEVFRRSAATARSLHPTHSVAGMGSLAGQILGSHHLDDTPCSPRSPFGLLAHHDGWVLLLGCGMDSCTVIHHVEEVVAPDLYLQASSKRATYICRNRLGHEAIVYVRHHLRLPRNFFQFQDSLAAEGHFFVARVDQAVCRAFRARDLIRVATRTLVACPDAIIAGPGQRYRMM